MEKKLLYETDKGLLSFILNSSRYKQIKLRLNSNGIKQMIFSFSVLWMSAEKRRGKQYTLFFLILSFSLLHFSLKQRGTNVDNKKK